MVVRLFCKCAHIGYSVANSSSPVSSKAAFAVLSSLYRYRSRSSYGSQLKYLSKRTDISKDCTKGFICGAVLFLKPPLEEGRFKNLLVFVNP